MNQVSPLMIPFSYKICYGKYILNINLQVFLTLFENIIHVKHLSVESCFLSSEQILWKLFIFYSWLSLTYSFPVNLLKKVFITSFLSFHLSVLQLFSEEIFFFYFYPISDYLSASQSRYWEHQHMERFPRHRDFKIQQQPQYQNDSYNCL